ncbi:hypothetical protein RINTHH_3650 [Richelia intracellularis HH01]|jgi:hypothetical protein|uniref:Uncharacterized protein n=1 Tax=Richelia intracellularis HH01 TaxID=1165094 RepID=M1X2B2_9NOST|nr:hypothetical protein RINTHH_3650 [Richelia intracellularis HH01]
MNFGNNVSGSIIAKANNPNIILHNSCQSSGFIEVKQKPPIA